VGEGAEKQRLVGEAERRRLDNVSFLPSVPRERVSAFYRSADVCLVPLRDISVFRTFIPSKIFEIMACARPIVASVAGEAAEILERSEAAIVVPPEDVEALSAAIGRLLEDRELAGTLAAQGRRFVVTHYDRSVLAARYLAILETLCEPRPDRSIATERGG
jgi:hypothetical protein